jgi:hypothetical protein
MSQASLEKYSNSVKIDLANNKVTYTHTYDDGEVTMRGRIADKSDGLLDVKDIRVEPSNEQMKNMAQRTAYSVVIMCTGMIRNKNIKEVTISATELAEDVSEPGCKPGPRSAIGGESQQAPVLLFSPLLTSVRPTSPHPPPSDSLQQDVSGEVCANRRRALRPDDSSQCRAAQAHQRA